MNQANIDNRIFYLSTCDTCKRILKEIDAKGKGFILQDIKSEPLTEMQLDALKEMAGSYEALFSRRSKQFRPLGLHEQTLGESDYKKYLLQHYSFLKRPVIVAGDRIFIGSDQWRDFYQ